MNLSFPLISQDKSSAASRAVSEAELRKAFGLIAGPSVTINSAFISDAEAGQLSAVVMVAAMRLLSLAGDKAVVEHGERWFAMMRGVTICIGNDILGSSITP